MMSVIAREFFEKSPVLMMPLLGLCIFGTTFVFVVWQTMRRNKSEIETLSFLPLEGGEKPHPAGKEVQP